ncbi:MAG: hypothetical protein NT149_03595 [Candidatus Gottesmanbacteria bacterium]|nr:hypothetical protein [Candidatus Gottesmanbacteria bacterium]
MRQSISRLLFIFVSFLFALMVLVPKAGAQNCTTQYGGGQSCQPVDLTINKEIKDLSTSNFFDNLSVSTSAFTVGKEFTFRLTIKNTSGETFHSVTIRDVFPPNMAYTGGPGTYDTGTRTLTINMDPLPADVSKSITFTAKVTSPMTSSQCTSNYAAITAIERPAGDDDTAQICVTGQVLGVQKLPVAGVNDAWILSMSVLSGVGGLALLLKK